MLSIIYSDCNWCWVLYASPLCWMLLCWVMWSLITNLHCPQYRQMNCVVSQQHTLWDFFWQKDPIPVHIERERFLSHALPSELVIGSECHDHMHFLESKSFWQNATGPCFVLMIPLKWEQADCFSFFIQLISWKRSPWLLYQMEIKWERARKQRDREREWECVCEHGWTAAIASVVNGQLENTSGGTNKIIMHL